MTWVALADQWERRFSLRGIGIDKQSAPVLQEDAGGAMMRGTLMFETRFSPEERPKVLLGYRHMKPAQRSLTIQVVPGGGIALVQPWHQQPCDRTASKPGARGPPTATSPWSAAAARLGFLPVKSTSSD